MGNENRIKKAISPTDFFRVLKRCFLFMILAALVCGAAAGAFAEFVMVKEYAVTLKFKVMAVDTSGNSGQNLSINIVPDVIELLRDDTDLARSVLSKMTTTDKNGNRVGVADTADNVAVFQHSLTTKRISGSSVFTVTITNTDAEVAYGMAKALSEVAPTYFAESEKVSFGQNATETGGLKLVRGAEMAKSSYKTPIAPNVLLISVWGAIAGAILCYLIFFLHFTLDTTIHTEDDLKAVWDYPVLGSIPSITPEATNKKRGEVKEHV